MIVGFFIIHSIISLLQYYLYHSDIASSKLLVRFHPFMHGELFYLTLGEDLVFYVSLILFKSSQDDEWVIMKGSVQWSPNSHEPNSTSSGI